CATKRLGVISPTCIVTGPEIVRAPVVVKVPVTSGNVEKSNTAVIVTGTGVGAADTESTEPIVKKATIHSMITSDLLFMFGFFIFNFPCLLFWPSLASLREKSVLILHCCTAQGSAGCYAGSWLRRANSLNRETRKRRNRGI